MPSRACWHLDSIASGRDSDREDRLKAPTAPQQPDMPDTHPRDDELERVRNALDAQSRLMRRLGASVRMAIDDVLAGELTGRFDLRSATVSKVERTYVGTRVELRILAELKYPRGATLDMLVEGVEVDIKTTIARTWMVPPEAVGRLCLLISFEEMSHRFRAGLLRANLEHLNRSQNRDQKRSVSRAGMAAIRWLGGAQWHEMPENFLLLLGPELRARVLACTSPEQRIAEAFRLCLDMPIPRSALATLARQLDPMRRVRGARSVLRAEGIEIKSGKAAAQRLEVLGRAVPSWRFFLSTQSASR